MANKKGCSESLIIRVMQIKTTMLEWLLSKRQGIISVVEVIEKGNPLCTVAGNVNLCIDHERQDGGSSKKKSEKCIYHSFQQFYIWGFILRN